MKSLDDLLGLSWIKYGTILIFAIVAMFFLYQYDAKRIDKAVENVQTKTENAALKENLNDAQKLNDQNRAINSAGSLVDRLLPVESKQTNNSEDQQNGAARINPADADANGSHIRGVESNHRMGTGNELPSANIFWRSEIEVLPVIPCHQVIVDDFGNSYIEDENGKIQTIETCQ